MKLSELISVLHDKLVDYGDIEVKFGELADKVVDTKLMEINDVTVESFEYGTNTVVIWDR